jgi:hypothetical protein
MHTVNFIISLGVLCWVRSSKQETEVIFLYINANEQIIFSNAQANEHSTGPAELNNVSFKDPFALLSLVLYVGVLISLRLFLFPIVLFPAQQK